MDQEILVKTGQFLVKALDDSNFVPRIAMWVHSIDTDTWKLWIVPPKGFKDKKAFYRKVSEIISTNRDQLVELDVSDTEMVSDAHPAMLGIGHFIRSPGISTIFFTGNRFNNFYLPDGIIIRSNL